MTVISGTVSILLGTLLLGASPVPAGENLLRNGDFALPADTGWTTRARSFDGRHLVVPLEDGGLRVHKDLTGFVRVFQDVPVSSPGLELAARLRPRAGVNKPGYFARAGLSVIYLGEDNAVLGSTRFLLPAVRTGFEDTDTERVVLLSSGSEWTDVRLDIAQELEEQLSGINPADLRAVRVELEAFVSGTGSC